MISQKSRLTYWGKPAKILSGWPVRAGSSRSISPWAAEASHAKAWGASFFAPVSPYRRAARATAPHRRAPRAARFALRPDRRPPPDALRRKAPRSVGRRPPWCRIRRSASFVLPAVRPFQSTQTGSRKCSLGGLLVAASGGRCGGAAVVWPSSTNRCLPGNKEPQQPGGGRPRDRPPKARPAFIGFSGRCGARKKPAARPRASQRHPPGAPCRGPRCGRRRSPPAGQNPCSTRRKPGRARRRAPLRGIALACWFRVAPAGGGRSTPSSLGRPRNPRPPCAGAPLPLPLIRPRRGRVLPVVPWCARAAGRRAKRGARGRAAGGTAGASARRVRGVSPPAADGRPRPWLRVFRRCPRRCVARRRGRRGRFRGQAMKKRR